MKRVIQNILTDWKNQKNRKVLLIRGARQVGKTYIVREFAKNFTYFLEANFEKNPDIHSFFDPNLDPNRICENLSVYFGVPIVEGKTLIFFDEIQSCLKAIHSLRFFYESKPGLHLIATGSLLEFAMKDLTSWGVGRIRSVYMYPMSFDEFLMANDQDGLISLKQSATFNNPLNIAFHEKLKEYLRKYLIVGGMPEAVQKYISDPMSILQVQNTLSDITTSYYDDFAKYSKRIPVLRLREVLGSVARQAGGKYIYSKAGLLSNPSQAKEALDLLEMAGLVYKVYHSSGQGLPIETQTNFKIFKAILHDTGIFQQISGLKLSEIIVSGRIEMLNKGHLAEIFAGNEMIKYNLALEKNNLHYWHRETRGSTAEVDYLIERNGMVVPVEVKSGITGKMQSLNLFMVEKNSSEGIRLSLENFSKYGKITVIPLYAISNLVQNQT